MRQKKGYDAGKKISGIRRHLAVDTNGFPHAILVTTAEKTDRNGAVEIVKKHRKSLTKVKNILADGGYLGQNFASEIRKITDSKVEIAKRNELEKSRRLWKNCEKLLDSSLAMTQLCFIRILLKRY